MSKGKGYVAIFGPAPPGELGGELIGFRGPGIPNERKRLSWRERAEKRRRAKLRRKSR